MMVFIRFIIFGIAFEKMLLSIHSATFSELGLAVGWDGPIGTRIRNVCEIYHPLVRHPTLRCQEPVAIQQHLSIYHIHARIREIRRAHGMGRSAY